MNNGRVMINDLPKSPTEMHGKSDKRLRQVVVSAKHVKREEADEADGEETHDARRPIQNFRQHFVERLYKIQRERLICHSERSEESLRQPQRFLVAPSTAREKNFALRSGCALSEVEGTLLGMTVSWFPVKNGRAS